MLVSPAVQRKGSAMQHVFPFPVPHFPPRLLLAYADSSVTRNASEKKINSLLDFMASATDVEVLQVGDQDQH